MPHQRPPREGRLILKLWLAFFAAACANFCDVGYSIEAVFAGTAAYEDATIVQIDLVASTVMVDWASGSPSSRTVTFVNTRKEGSQCAFYPNSGQSFTADAGEKTTFLLRGSNLTEAVRLLIAGGSETCGALTATQDAAVTAPPGEPIGVGDMYFFDIVVSAAGSYKVCFWSGYSVAGKGAADVTSYATTIGTLTVSQIVVTTTTTTAPSTVFSRRRALTYSSTSFRIDASSGWAYEDLTANPAAWNIYSPRLQDPTCRNCQPYSLQTFDSNIQQFEVNRLYGTLKAAPGPSASDLGEGCEDSSLVNATAPQAPPSLLLIRRGGCSFQEKAAVAAAAGFAGILVVDYLADSDKLLPDMALAGGITAEASTSLPPAWFLPKSEGDVVFAALAAGLDEVLSASVVDVERKPRLSSGLSDPFGSRSYEAK